MWMSTRCSSPTQPGPQTRSMNLLAGVPGHPWSAKQAANTSGQLSGRERFGQVVVRADGQADEGVDLFAAGGQHDDVGVAEGAQVAADLEAVDAGHHQVQHGDVGWIGSRRDQSLLSVGGRGDHEALMLEVAANSPDQAGLVVHDQRPKRGAGRGCCTGCPRDQESSMAMNPPCQAWYEAAPVEELTDIIPLTAPFRWRSRVKYPG